MAETFDFRSVALARALGIIQTRAGARGRNTPWATFHSTTNGVHDGVSLMRLAGGQFIFAGYLILSETEKTIVIHNTTQITVFRWLYNDNTLTPLPPV